MTTNSQFAPNSSILKPQSSNGQLQSGFSFKYMTYNILADGLSGAHNEVMNHKTFLNVPRAILAWEHREPEIIREVLENDPDLVCMQEVDKHEELLAILEPHGYSGVHYHKLWSPIDKISAGKTTVGHKFEGSEAEKAVWRTAKHDGVAIYYKSDVFTLVEAVPFYQRKERYNILNALIGQKYLGHDVRERLETKLSRVEGLLVNDQVDFRVLQEIYPQKDQFTLLKCMRLAREELGMGETTHFVAKDQFVEWILTLSPPHSLQIILQPTAMPSIEIVIVNFHLYSDKALEGERVRCQELQGLLTHPHLRESIEPPNRYLFLAGDMNSSAERNHREHYPPLGYRYITGSPVEQDMNDDDEKDAEIEMVEPTDILLRSAYRDYFHEGRREPDFSTWKFRMPKQTVNEDKHTIDFIFYQPERWQVEDCLRLPVDDVLTENLPEFQSPLPNAKNPSDHLPLMSEFRFTENNPNQLSFLFEDILRQNQLLINKLQRENEQLVKENGRLVEILNDKLEQLKSVSRRQ